MIVTKKKLLEQIENNKNNIEKLNDDLKHAYEFIDYLILKHISENSSCFKILPYDPDNIAESILRNTYGDKTIVDLKDSINFIGDNPCVQEEINLKKGKNLKWFLNKAYIKDGNLRFQYSLLISEKDNQDGSDTGLVNTMMLNELRQRLKNMNSNEQQ